MTSTEPDQNHLQPKLILSTK